MSIRHALPADVDTLADIEAASYPPAEGASRQSIAGRVAVYPDLAIHRIMTAQLKGTDKDTMILRYSEFAEDVSKQASEREVIAMQIERKAEDCYKAEYARRHLGECYEGRISGVTQRGLFIELENGVEGFVPASSLTATGTMLTEGVRLSDPVSGKNWNLGDTMMITIVRADVNLGKIDFEVAPESAKQ